MASATRSGTTPTPSIRVPDGYHGPINANPDDGESRISIYGYTPSAAANGVAAALFLILLLVHLFYFFRFRRTRVYQFLIVFGCTMELVGYIFRVLSHANPFVVIRFVLNYFFIVCAPVFFSAAIYIGLGSLLPALPPRASPLSAKVLLALFVTIDVVTIATQIVGAALVGQGYSAQVQDKKVILKPERANDILIGGLAVQSAASLVFMLILLVVIFRTRRTFKVSGTTTALFALLAGDVFIVLRTLFRLAEAAEGTFSSTMTNQDLFIALEMTPVIVAVAVFAAVPLGRYLSEYRYSEGDSEVKA